MTAGPSRRGALAGVAGIVGSIAGAALLASAVLTSPVLGSASQLGIGSERLMVVAVDGGVPERTCTLPATADTYTEVGGTVGLGSLSQMDVLTGSLIRARSYVRFDLAACGIPAGALLLGAELRIRMLTAPLELAIPPVARNRQYLASRVTADWQENVITALTAPPSAAAPTAAVMTGTAAPGTLRWDVTDDVRGQLGAPATHHGWMIKDAAEPGPAVIRSTLATREHPTAPEPTLVLTYHP